MIMLLAKTTFVKFGFLLCITLTVTADREYTQFERQAGLNRFLPIKRLDDEYSDSKQGSNFMKRFDLSPDFLSALYEKRTPGNVPSNGEELPPVDTSLPLRNSLRKIVQDNSDDGSEISQDASDRISELSEARSKVFGTGNDQSDEYLAFDFTVDREKRTQDENTLPEPDSPPTVVQGMSHPDGDNIYQYILPSQEKGESQEVSKFRNPSKFKEFSRSHFLMDEEGSDPAEDLDNLLSMKQRDADNDDDSGVSATFVLRSVSIAAVSLLGMTMAGVMCYTSYRGRQLRRQQDLHRRLEFDPEENLRRPQPSSFAQPDPEMEPGEEAWAQVYEKRQKQDRIRYGTKPRQPKLNCDPRKPSGYESDNEDTEEEDAYATPQIQYTSDDPENSEIQEFASGFSAMNGVAVENPTFQLGPEAESTTPNGKTEDEFDFVSQK